MVSQTIVRILSHMSEIIQLKHDNLVDHFGGNMVLAVFSKEGCGACTQIKKHLVNLPDKYTVVIVDGLKHMASKRYFPGGVKYYPTIGLYDNGYFKGEITQLNIINNQIE